jgi:hypothetical protein
MVLTFSCSKFILFIFSFGGIKVRIKNSLWFANKLSPLLCIFVKGNVENAKGVIRNRTSKSRRYNGRNKGDSKAKRGPLIHIYRKLEIDQHELH